MQKSSTMFGEVFKTVFWALLLALVIRSLLIQSFTIPSGSMIPTLKVGDFIAVSKISHGYSKHSFPLSPPIMQGRFLERAPKHGEVLVFKTPRDNRTDFIKRVVGLPGDRIKMRNGDLYINGRAVQKSPTGVTFVEKGYKVIQYEETLPNGASYMVHQYDCRPEYKLSCSFNPYNDHLTYDNTIEYVVPPNSFFAIGDNRDNSRDSRSDDFTYVPYENIVGRAKFVFLSFEGASLFKPWTWVTKFRPLRMFKSAQG